jgi:peptidoglycan/LPS O-acetylase OafA/YrhL
VLFSARLLKSQKANYAVIGVLWLMAIGFSFLRMKMGIKAPIAMPLGLSLMFMGYVWRKWLLREEAIPASRLMVMGGLYALLIPLISFMGYKDAAWMSINTYFIAMALFLLFTTVLRLRHPALRFLGKISYSVYLIHCLVGQYVIKGMVRLMPEVFLQNNYLIFLPMLAAMVVSLGIATLTYYWIEEPFVKLGKDLAKKVLPSRANLSPVSAA